ncbi:MAG: hypothetical protein RL757_3048 [Bacteroidota bacterium]|jgi:predicted Zn-dependent peptidase
MQMAKLKWQLTAMATLFCFLFSMGIASAQSVETVPNDPIGAQVYTLKNGLKLYMSVNKNEPRIYTNIAVRAGSKQDPAATTGLAHYLEHMVFKGTSQIGSLNWAEESKLLEQISDLYEKHRVETDLAKRKIIYGQIDSVSNIAAKFVAANEYDKMISSLGAKGTNAYTSNEQTVYVNDIPSNGLEKWFKLEGERFRMLVLRLFHTELEAVYEEFNIGQDNDGRKSYFALMEALFPTHQYGTQTTIGTGEHLKTPSHVNIHKFFDTYYVPNNMAIVIAGDFDPAQAIQWAEKYFGDYKSKSFPEFTFTPQPEIKGVVKRDVFGQQAASVSIGWRMAGANSAEADVLTVLDQIMSNSKAGLMDLNLLQQQKVLEAGSNPIFMTDYSVWMMSGKPREGQQLEDVEKLMIGELEKIRKGQFEDWLVDAAIKDIRLSQIRGAEANTARVGQMADAFIKGAKWSDKVARLERLKKVTRQQIIDMANKLTRNDNYVVVYKRVGEDKTIVKVEKPKITPVKLNRKDQSDFAKNFFGLKNAELKPEFVDFKTAISNGKLKSTVPLDYIKNTTNELFQLNYVIEMGKNSDKKMPFAVNYLPFLGTDKLSAAKLQQEFYRLGISFDVFSGDDRAYVTLSGLNESLEAGVKLFENVLKNVKPDEAALKNMVADELSKRDNDKKDKRIILRSAMNNYARFGKLSPFTDVLTEEELNKMTSAELVARIKDMTNFQHSIFYYGPTELTSVQKVLDKYHKVPKKLKPVLAPKDFKEMATEKDKVIFVDFPMVQTEILMLSKGTPQYSLEEQVMATVFNNYFGGGLSSIVFQEIREARALAYSASAFYTSPAKKDKSHYFQAYVGTQLDKLKDAVPAMRDIIENMPISDAQIEQARQSVMKQIESERITKSNIYWTSKANQDRGLDYDYRKDVYEKMKNMTVADMKAFHAKHVKGRNYTVLVIGDKKKMDMEFLKTIGEVEELTLQQVFGEANASSAPKP